MTEETVEDAAKEYCKTWINYEKTEIASRYGFLAGAKWQAERMYSEEEVIEMFDKFNMHLPFNYEFLVKEQFKKK